MIADEQDRTVTRLRHELGAVDVHSHVDQVDRMLRRVHARRREQRQHQVQMVAALAVVLIAIAGAFVVNWRPTGTDQAAPPGAPVMHAPQVFDWTVRGEFAEDKALQDRAVEVWQHSATPPKGEVHTIFAGQRLEYFASMVVIAMVSEPEDGRSQIAYVTSPVSAHKKPNRDALAVRAVATVAPGSLAVGFLATRPAPDDEPLKSPSTIGFVLGAPGVLTVNTRSSVIDDCVCEGVPVMSDIGVGWVTQMADVGVWNTVIEVPVVDGTPATAALAASVHDVSAEPITLKTEGSTTTAIGDVLPGDVIVTSQGVVGVVANARGTIDTRLTEVAKLGKIGIEHSVAGRLEERDGTVVFKADSPGVNPTNRVVLTKDGVIVNVGRIAQDRATVERAVDPQSATDGLRLRF